MTTVPGDTCFHFFANGRNAVWRGLARAMQAGPDMRGFITDQHIAEAECAFPGIQALYQALGDERPKTFLELVARYLRAVACGTTAAHPISRDVSRRTIVTPGRRLSNP